MLFFFDGDDVIDDVKLALSPPDLEPDPFLNLLPNSLSRFMQYVVTVYQHVILPRCRVVVLVSG